MATELHFVLTDDGSPLLDSGIGARCTSWLTSRGFMVAPLHCSSLSSHSAFLSQDGRVFLGRLTVSAHWSRSQQGLGRGVRPGEPSPCCFSFLPLSCSKPRVSGIVGRATTYRWIPSIGYGCEQVAALRLPPPRAARPVCLESLQP